MLYFIAPWRSVLNIHLKGPYRYCDHDLVTACGVLRSVWRVQRAYGLRAE
jgi:hypothetical protein